MAKKKIDFDRPTPLYEQIVEDLRRRIETGEFKPLDQIGTQSELSHAYGVSLITVKNAVSRLVREGLLTARAGRGIFVSRLPKVRVDLKGHGIIGLVLRDLKHPYFSMIVHSVEQRAYELGFNILLSDSSGSFEKEEGQIDRFKSLGVNGLIIASLSLEYRATEYIQRLHREDFPYVMVSYIHDPDFWYVGSDHELGGYMATEHLIRLGYRSIGYVHPGQVNLLAEVRKNGYRRALLENNLPHNSEHTYDACSDEFGPGADRYQLGVAFARKFAAMEQRPEALFFYNDMVALAFIQTASELGIRSNRDLPTISSGSKPRICLTLPEAKV